MGKHRELSFFLNKVEVGNVGIYRSGNASGELEHHLILQHVDQIRELFNNTNLAFVRWLRGRVPKMTGHLLQHFMLVSAGRILAKALSR